MICLPTGDGLVGFAVRFNHMSPAVRHMANEDLIGFEVKLMED